MSTRGRAWWLLLAAGCLLSFAALWLPWRAEDFRLGVGVRLVMTSAGAVLLARVARTADRSAPVVAVGVLGAAVIVYPTLLSLAAADVGGPAVAVLGAAGHVLPLTLVQLAPVVASRAIVGRAHRRWEATIVAVAVCGVLLVGVGLAGVPGASLLLGASTVLWFASFLLAPGATWAAVRGTGGETRLRAVVAGLAALVPVVVLSWCLALGVLTADLGPDVAVTALMLGFSLGTCAGGLLTLGACGPPGSTALRTRVVMCVLHVVVAALLLIVGTVASLGVAALGVPSAWSVLVGAAAALLAGLPWWRLHTWTRRVVDPTTGLRHELAALAEVLDGHHRLVALRALRRIVGDPDLVVAYDVGDRTLHDSADSPVDPADMTGAVVLATHPDGAAAVRALPSTAAGRPRLAALGDCSVALRPALLEARLAHESRRADQAAEAERRQLTQDLHDGLQGRLLGLALQLQLGARGLANPEATLLVGDAVAGLRAAVDDVRSLGGGHLPGVLVSDGLQPALTALFASVGSIVQLELPSRRMAVDVEATVYFLVGEAVSNALKHAEADRVRVAVELSEPDCVRVTVSDDGRGGADPRLGSGLRGVTERVSAAGGVLVIHDGAPGTTVEAVLPCGS